MLTYKQIKSKNNLVSLLDDNKLIEIGSAVVRGYEIDEESRSEWMDTINDALKIAKQIREEKSFPWEGAANVKMPIITRACIDYASRTLPQIIQNNKIVKGVIVGRDPDNKKQIRSDRVSTYMSYQLINKSEDWVSGTDCLLQILPLLGTVFRKVYYDDMTKMPCSELCVPDKIVVNYDVPSLEKARRITHVLPMYKNDIVERQRRKIYDDSFDVKTLMPDMENVSISDDKDFCVTILEQHCWWDLDNDGYEEPYVVTVHKESGKVLRIINRIKSAELENGKVITIVPQNYFVDYHFIRSPDGGFYSMGFGSLLLPLNATINTIINQLLDAGTLNNVQGGFLGRGLRVKNGEFKIKMGEWKVLDVASGTDIKNNIFPMPTKEPSTVLLNLLELLLGMAKDLSSTTDVLSGKQPAQNVASGAISQLIEQGTMVFTAINKRVYRSLTKEYKKIYELNYYYLPQDDYFKVLDDPQANVKADFELNTLDIYPVADPSLSSDQQKLQRASVVQTLPTVDRRAADELIIDSLELDPAQKKALLPPQDPNAPPPADVQKVMAEIQQIQANIANISAQATLAAEQVQIAQAKFKQEMDESNSRIFESQARVWKMQQDALNNMRKLGIVSEKMQFEEDIKGANLINKAQFDKQQIELDKALAQHQMAKDITDSMLENKALDIKSQEKNGKIDESKS